MKEQIKTLKHLDQSIPESAKGYLLSGYSIALEGWRRGLGLSIKVIYEKQRKIPIFTFSNGQKSVSFKYTRANTVSQEAIRICINKELTKEALLKANIETPIGKKFENESTNEDLLQYAQEIGYPVVIKPSDGTGGKGVIANIKSDNELLEALHYLKVSFGHKGDFIVEKFYKGQDYRLYVIGDEVVAAYKRDPASVLGNGIDSIQTLINQKNKIRQQNPALETRPITVDDETTILLKRIGYDLQSVPADGEMIVLKSKNNVTSGGEAIDMTNEITPEMKAIAVSAIQAIPTLTHAGVDMIIDEETNTGAVIEINSRPHITSHLYPALGKSRDIPSALIDYFFPETKGYDRDKRIGLYFDMDTILELTYHTGNMQEVIVPPIPGDIVLKRLQLTLPKKRKTFSKWLQLRATIHHVSGYIKPFEKTLSVILAGTEENIRNLEKRIKEKLNTYDFETSLVSKTRKSPVKQGFYNFVETPEPTKVIPKTYKADVNQLIKTIYETNRQIPIKEPIDGENDIVKSQLKVALKELAKFRKRYGDINDSFTTVILNKFKNKFRRRKVDEEH